VGGAAPGSDRTIWLIISYLGILSLIPFFAKKDDAEVQWHAKNGVVLFGAECIVWIVLLILSFALRGMLSCGLGVLQCVIWIGFLALSVYCIVQAMGGKRPRLPVITDFAEKM
jgi:uncharacterized membrane protein